MPRLALALLVALTLPASAQRAPQFAVGGGLTVVDGGGGPLPGGTSLLGSATVTAWPSPVGVAVHAEFGRQFLFDSEPSAAAVGLLAAVALSLGTSHVTLAAGPSLSRDTPSATITESGWTLGGMARATLTVPVGGVWSAVVDAGATASADGVRPSSTVGLALRLGD